MRDRVIAGVALAAVVLLLPVLAGPFLRYLALNMLLLALLALSFNLLFGMTGLLSFGQGAFYSGGAYAAALLLRAGMPLLWSIVLGSLAAAAAVLPGKAGPDAGLGAGAAVPPRGRADGRLVEPAAG